MSVSKETFHFARWWLRAGRWIVLAVVLVVFASGYLRLAGLLVAQTNNTDKNILGADQKHNMKTALLTRADLKPDFSKGVSEPIKDWFPHRTDGVLQPLWPWIAAWLAHPDQQISAPDVVTVEDRAFFNRGRWFNVGLTLGFLVVLGIACARIYSLPAALNVLLLTGFGALLPRSVYFQPEPLFFIFFLLTWVCCILALKQNSLWSYGLVGAFSGIAYMAKGSVQPLVAVFAGVSTLRWMWGWVMARWPGQSTSLWIRRNHLFGLFMMAACHLIAVGPRLADSAERFGDPFHSYPAYWMWFDDFDSGYRWMNEHGTREELAGISPADKPSFSNYSASHTTDQMLDRLTSGTRTKLLEFLSPGVTPPSRTQKPWKGVLEKRGIYLGALLVILVALGAAVVFATPKTDHPGERLHPESVAIALFVLVSFIAYALLYGWYTPIGRGDRFMLSLYAPLVLSFVWAGEAFLKRARRRKAHRSILIAYEAAHWLLFAAVSWRIIEILQFPYFRN